MCCTENADSGNRGKEKWGKMKSVSKEERINFEQEND